MTEDFTFYSECFPFPNKFSSSCPICDAPNFKENEGCLNCKFQTGSSLEVEKIKNFKNYILRGERGKTARTNNKNVDLAAKTFRELHQIEPNGFLFSKLMKSRYIEIVIWVAAYFLTKGNNEAKEILERIVKVNKRYSFTSEMTLKEHSKGSLGNPFREE